MQELSQAIEIYGSLKRAANEAYGAYLNLKVKAEEARQDVSACLQESGLKSAKSTNFGVSTVTKPSISVLDEQAVREWLETTPNIESDFYIGVKLTAFKTLAMQVLKETGEIIPGTDLENKETISIKANK